MYRYVSYTASSLPPPKWHQIDCIEGSGKKVNLITQVAARWERVATRLYFQVCDIDRIKKDTHHSSIPACSQVFKEWLEGKGRHPTTWETVIKALKEAELSEVAKDLEIIIRAKMS